MFYGQTRESYWSSYPTLVKKYVYFPQTIPLMQNKKSEHIEELIKHLKLFDFSRGFQDLQTPWSILIKDTSGLLQLGSYF